MRVLFYGGCHAGVMHQVFARHCQEPGFIGTYIVNYQLIDKAADFPYHILSNFDAIVYSPILNKGPFNTSFLEERCDAIGLKRVSYPWLQWAGYHTGAEKRPPVDWMYPAFVRARREHATFASFKAWALNDATTPEAVHAYLDHTTRHLREHEDRGAPDIRVSDYILDNYRAKRLFVTPDHPSTELYKHVFRSVAEKLGVTMDPAMDDIAVEFHDDHLLPIMPVVAKTLGLDFRAGDFGFVNTLGRRWYSYTEMLEIFYYADQGVELLSPEYGAPVIVDGHSIEITAKQLIFARQLRKSNQYQVLSGPDVVEKKLGASRFLERKGEWWNAFPLAPYVDVLAD